jgi:hypothetical protein
MRRLGISTIRRSNSTQSDCQARAGKIGCRRCTQLCAILTNRNYRSIAQFLDAALRYLNSPSYPGYLHFVGEVACRNNTRSVEQILKEIRGAHLDERRSDAARSGETNRTVRSVAR